MELFYEKRFWSLGLSDDRYPDAGEDLLVADYGEDVYSLCERAYINRFSLQSSVYLQWLLIYFSAGKVCEADLC